MKLPDLRQPVPLLGAAALLELASLLALVSMVAVRDDLLWLPFFGGFALLAASLATKMVALNKLGRGRDDLSLLGFSSAVDCIVVAAALRRRAEGTKEADAGQPAPEGDSARDEDVSRAPDRP